MLPHERFISGNLLGSPTNSLNVYGVMMWSKLFSARVYEILRVGDLLAIFLDTNHILFYFAKPSLGFIYSH